MIVELGVDLGEPLVPREAASGDGMAMIVKNPTAPLPVGTVLHNPVTSEWGRVLCIDDDATRIELVVAPGGGVPVTHLHRHQTETFDVLSGELTVVLDDFTRRFYPGDTAVIKPGVAHRWTASGDEPLHCVMTVAPSLHFADMIAASWGLCATGRARPDGGARIADAILMAEAFGDDIEIPSPPRWLTRLIVGGLGRFVRATGRRVDDASVMTAAVVDSARWPGPLAANPR